MTLKNLKDYVKPKNQPLFDQTSIQSLKLSILVPSNHQRHSLIRKSLLTWTEMAMEWISLNLLQWKMSDSLHKRKFCILLLAI